MYKFLTMILFLFLCAQPASAETLEIPGTGACEAILKELAAAFNQQNPRNEIIIPPSTGSEGGIKSVIENKNILARVARPPKDDEIGYGLSYLVFAKDVVVFAVGEKVNIQSLTIPQIVDIFAGKIDNWQQVGGDDAIIRVLTREPGDSSLMVIQQHIKEFRTSKFTEKSKMLFHDCEMVEMLTKYKTSIGWLTGSSITAAKTSIKPLSVDNITPTVENALNGTYTLIEDQALVYKKSHINEAAKEFIDFIFSESGREILKKNGAIPVNRK